MEIYGNIPLLESKLMEFDLFDFNAMKKSARPKMRHIRRKMEPIVIGEKINERMRTIIIR